MVTSINFFIILIAYLSIFLFWMRNIFTSQAFVSTPAFKLLLAGSAILGLPLLWTPEYRFPVAAWRVAGLACGLVLLLTFLQIQWRRASIMIVLYGIVVSATIQAIIAGQQLLMRNDAWVPLYGLRAYGTFFQPNVLASFLSTGLVLAMILLIHPLFALNARNTERLRKSGLFILLMGISLILVWVQSRAGLLGAVISILLMLWRFGPQNSKRTAYALIAIAIGGVIGVITLRWGLTPVMTIEHTQSNWARWTMLRDSLSMIFAKPWLGWGYGGFEYEFQHFRINQVPPTAVTEIARHPHNEIMLWLIEGGLIALAGLLLILCGGCYLVRQALRHDHLVSTPREAWTGLPTALCISLLPIALHTQLEFPFYLSAGHAVVFVLLFAMADRISRHTFQDTQPQILLKQNHRCSLAVVMAGLALCITVTAGFALKGSLTLLQVEKFGMEDITPLEAMPRISRVLNQERIGFDKQINTLLKYNHSRDEQLLDHYAIWARDYLQRRIDRNVYATLLQILRHQNKYDLEEQYRQDAVRLFPADIRFIAIRDGQKEKS